ncbi:MAG: 3-deoxy-7-phosphoheptulonate synthase [Clostridia bacterium]|nr:3-deoxy-7-phosphoheptulonate synthase [Clostridia bacterium]
MEMIFRKQLLSPESIKEQFPLPPAAARVKKERDEAIRRVLTGESDQKLLIIGPCSADRADAVLEYIGRLARVQDEVKERLIIIPRIYTNKPRTTGDGYKGMASQPNPHLKEDIGEGVIAIRRLHLAALTQTGFSCADEMLYPENHSYLDDLLAYVAVGARSVENQQHRLVASGIGMPVGMKNPTSGDMTVMLNSIMAAQHPHVFSYRQWEVETPGNPLAHAILRGFVNEQGQSRPNYHWEDLDALYDAYSSRGLANMAVIVDANHSNSGKKYLEQVRICKEVLHSCRHNAHIAGMVKGFMVESYLEDGAQKVGGEVYGQSITDPCLGWAKTEALILSMAEQLG